VRIGSAIKALPERHHFLPDKMAVWRKDEAQKALSNIPFFREYLGLLWSKWLSQEGILAISQLGPFFSSKASLRSPNFQQASRIHHPWARGVNESG